MFVHYSKTKAEFIAAGLPTTYTNYIVFIKGDANGNGSCIYTHGSYFANFTELISALNYVKGINVEGTSYNAAAGGGYVAFGSKDPATVAVNVSETGIEIGLTETFIKKVDDVVALAATINGDYLKAADRTALEGLISTADGKGQEALTKVNELLEDIGDISNLAEKPYVDEVLQSRVFVGTQEEYDTAYAEGKIAMGALVIILDGGETEEGGTTISALLGTAILGQMLLGQK